MNCANHADASAVAYCRTCGKALCANCTRPVRGVIYCEDCLGARMEGRPTAAGFVSGTVAAPARIPPPIPAGSSTGPNPTVAGILAGFFPFGVGAVYNGQYAKGLAHLAIFGLLVAGVSASDSGHSEALGVICGFGIAFFYVYQIIDSVRSATGHSNWPARAGPLRSGGNLWRRGKDRDQQNPDGRDRAHLDRRALPAAHHGTGGIRPRPLLAVDFDRTRRLVVRPQLGPDGCRVARAADVRAAARGG